jgi:hypothetical protein
LLKVLQIKFFEVICFLGSPGALMIMRCPLSFSTAAASVDTARFVTTGAISMQLGVMTPFDNNLRTSS